MDVYEFKNLIWNYSRKLPDKANTIFSPICEEHGVTVLQSRVLLELHCHGDHTIGSLANNIYVAEANVSSMCKRLENQGLLQRFRDCQDERVVKVRLTERGAQVTQVIDEAMNEKFRPIVEDGDTDYHNIIQGLQKLNELLRKLATPCK